MMTTLLAAALFAPAAPVPGGGTPTGPAPYILNLRPGSDGTVKITVMRTETQKVNVIQAIAGPNGAQQVQPVEREITTNRYVSVELADLKDIKVYSADGKEVPVKDAVKKVNDGGVVVVSADGKKVDPIYLKLLKEDVLVFVSPELVPQGGYGYPMPGVRPGRPGVMPLPAPALPPAPGGNVQIQVLPALPLQPALPVVPPPAKK